MMAQNRPPDIVAPLERCRRIALRDAPCRQTILISVKRSGTDLIRQKADIDAGKQIAGVTAAPWIMVPVLPRGGCDGLRRPPIAHSVLSGRERL
jgi:hypothetical protein